MIKAKRALRLPDLLEMEYEPRSVAQVVVCENTDPVLETVCDLRSIKVWTPE